MVGKQRLSGEEVPMKKLYKVFCSVEELICGGILCAIVAFAFATAVGRCINHPISWTVELCQFLLSWLAFLGADLALRQGSILGVDIIMRRAPKKVQAAAKIITNLIILALLLAFIKYGVNLCKSNYKRSFKTLGISYSWATASLPVASVLMSITMIVEIVKSIRILLGKEEEVGA